MFNDNMQDEIEKKDGFGKAVWVIKEFWFVALVFASIITGWTSIRNDVKYQEARITALEVRSKVVDETLNKVASDVSYIRGLLENK